MTRSRAPRETRGILLMSERADFFGGGQQSLLDLAGLLAASPFPPIAVLPGPGPLATALEERGVAVRFLTLPAVGATRGGRVARAISSLATMACREGIAVLHSDSPRTALYAGMAARLARAAHLWHVRASVGSSAFADRVLLGLSHAVVAVSRAAARRSVPLARSARVEVVHTGLRPPAFLERGAARAALGLPNDGLIAAVVGRVEPDKGGEDAIACLPVLRAAAPGAGLAFLGPIDLEAAWPMTLRLRASALGLAGEVFFLGARDRSSTLMRAFDLVLHPSRHEALPRVLIEALYAGVPVVAYAVGGVPEIVDHGRTGLLAPARDAAAFGAATAALAGDPARRLAFGRAGAVVAPDRFSIEAMGRAMGRIYAGLIDARIPERVAAS